VGFGEGKRHYRFPSGLKLRKKKTNKKLSFGIGTKTVGKNGQEQERGPAGKDEHNYDNKRKTLAGKQTEVKRTLGKTEPGTMKEEKA